MGSSRLPGKAMIEVVGKPLLGHIIDRVKLAEKLDKVVVCTSTSPENDVIESYCLDNNISCFRGQEQDVTARMIDAFKHYGASVGVTIFGDCPLVDPKIIDEIVTCYLEKSDRYDFVGNDLETSYPPGMEVEAFSIDAFTQAASEVSEDAIREHGTLVLRGRPEKYRLLNISAPSHLARPELEIEVDEAIDLNVVEAIIGALGAGKEVDLRCIIRYLDSEPRLRDSNQAVSRRWKDFRDS